MQRTLKFHASSFARGIALTLQAIPYTDTAYEQVPGVFLDALKTVADLDDRYEVFRLLDEKPGLFPNYIDGHWFRLLRQCRNRPDPSGHLLFAVLRGEIR